MIHPLFMAVLRRPGLLISHLANYVALLRESTTDVVRGLVAKAVAWVVVGVCLFLGLGFTGVAAMLGALGGRFHWVLVAVPGAAFLLALISAMFAMRSVVQKEIHDVAVELEADQRAMNLVRDNRND